MRLVEPVGRAERQADGVNGKGVVGAQSLDGLQRRRSRQIVLGVDLEKAGRRPVAPDLRQMRRAQPDAGDRRSCDQLEVSLPPTIFSQVPLGTEIQASACASFLDVPAHEDAAVWQSFLPALETP